MSLKKQSYVVDEEIRLCMLTNIAIRLYSALNFLKHVLYESESAGMHVLRTSVHICTRVCVCVCILYASVYRCRAVMLTTESSSQ